MADLSGPRISYEPGEHVGVVGADYCFIGDVDRNSSFVGELWELLRTSAPAEPIESLMRAVVGSDFAALIPGSARGLLVLLSGRATARIELVDDVVEMACPPLARMSSTVLDELPLKVILKVAKEPNASVEELPLAAGVVAADSLAAFWSEDAVVAFDSDRAPTTLSSAQPAAGPKGAGIESEGLESAIEHIPQVRIVETAGSDVAGPAPEPEPVPADGSPSAAAPEVTLPPDAVPRPDEHAVSGSPRHVAPNHPENSESAPEPIVPSEFAELFGATVDRTVEEAAIRRNGGPDWEPPESDPVAPATPQPDGLPPVSALAPPTPTPIVRSTAPPSAGLIDSVPWASDDRDAPTLPPGPTHAPDLQPTVQRSAHGFAGEQAERVTGLAPVGPTVIAVKCRRDHLNPTHQSHCRVCSAPIHEQTPVTVARPALGVLRLSTGDDIVLDRSVLLGRSPTADRTINNERPHVVKLPSPGTDISRNHAEVRVDGWHVFVVDLASTNGTVIERPGQPPERLRPNDPTMIEPGTVVMISEDVSLTFVVT